MMPSKIRFFCFGPSARLHDVRPDTLRMSSFRVAFFQRPRLWQLLFISRSSACSFIYFFAFRALFES